MEAAQALMTPTSTSSRRRTVPRSFSIKDELDGDEGADSGGELVSPAPSSRGTKKRGSDTARKDRSDLLKAYLLEIGVIRIRGARRRRNNDDGSPAGGKVDWDSEYVQQTLTIAADEFEAIRLDYERRSERKRLNDQTIERDWTTDGGVRRPAAKMLKNFYPTNLILHRFFDIVINGVMRDRPVSAARMAELSAIDPFLKCRPLALVLLPDLDDDDDIVDPNNHHHHHHHHQSQQGLRLYPMRNPRSETSRLEFSSGTDVITIETYKPFEDQLSLIGRPGFQQIVYLDDMLAPDVAPYIRQTDTFRMLWNSAFSRGGQDPATLHEVEESLFLSCFREQLRPTLRYLLFAPYANKTTLTLSEFCLFMEWAVGLASQPDAEHSATQQLQALITALQQEDSQVGGLPYTREPLALHLTSNGSKPRSSLKRAGDFFLRSGANKAQPTAIVLEFMVPNNANHNNLHHHHHDFDGMPMVSTWQLEFFFQDGRIHFRDANKVYPSLGQAIVEVTAVDHFTRLRQCCEVPIVIKPPAITAADSNAVPTPSSKSKRKYSSSSSGDLISSLLLKDALSPNKRMAVSSPDGLQSYTTESSTNDSPLSTGRTTTTRSRGGSSLHFFGSSEPSPNNSSSSTTHHQQQPLQQQQQLYHHHHVQHTIIHPQQHVTQQQHQPLHLHLHQHQSVVPQATPQPHHHILHHHHHIQQPVPHSQQHHHHQQQQQQQQQQAPPLFMGSGDLHSLLLLHPVGTLAGDSLFGDLPVPSDSFADTIGLSQLELSPSAEDHHGHQGGKGVPPPLAWPSSDDIMNDPNVYNLIVNLAP